MLSLAGRLTYLALLVAAGAIDARERRFPNALAGAMAALAAACAFAEGACGAVGGGMFPLAAGAVLLAGRLVFALAVCGALVAFELIWRRVRGSAGLGLGDVKLLFSLVLMGPIRAIIALAFALIALAFACLAARRPSLPLIPFIAGAWALLGAGTLVCR